MDILKTKDFELINPTPNAAKLYLKDENESYEPGSFNNWIVLDFGNKQKGDNVEISFIFKSDKHTISSAGASCGCTTPTVTKINDTEQQVAVRFDTNRITRNVSKWVTLYLNRNTNESVKINLVINK